MNNVIVEYDNFSKDNIFLCRFHKKQLMTTRIQREIHLNLRCQYQ